MRPVALLLLLAATACRTTQVVGPPIAVVPEVAADRTVVLEPFFEVAEWKLSTRSENATVFSSFGTPQDVVISRQVAEKPLFARVPVLADLYRRVLLVVKQKRPSWRVRPTSQLPESGPVVLIRTLIGDTELAGSDRTLKNLITMVGLGIPACCLLVNEVLHVDGGISRFDADAATLRPRLLRYPTQPDFAVDVRGLTPWNQPFGLELEYEEGVFVTDPARDQALLAPFAERLAVAIIALVEGVRTTEGSPR